MIWKKTRKLHCSSDGFTLLEVLVAFVILAISMGVVLNVFSSGLDSGRKAEARVVAVLLAQSKLASLEAERPLAVGESEGRFDRTYFWRATVEPYSESEELSDRIPDSIAAYRLSVTVHWSDSGSRSGAAAGGGPGRQVTLATLRLAAAE